MYMPNNIINAKRIWTGFSLFFVKKGSNNPVITGNVNMDNIPIATFDNFIKKLLKAYMLIMATYKLSTLALV